MVITIFLILRTDHQLNIFDDELVQKVFNKWWRQTAKDVYQREVDSYYDKVIRKYNVDKPTITIKKMKTLWGSCSPQKCKITLNEYLMKANIRCIQYVVLQIDVHLHIIVVKCQNM